MHEPELDAAVRRICYTVTQADDVGRRADVVAGQRMPGISRRSARQMGLRGHLFVNGHIAAPSTRLQDGDILELAWLRPEPAFALEVLATSPRFVYAHKPAGVHTHRLRPDQPLALADLVAEKFPECRQTSDDARELGATHRLDGDTSGVVVFARSRRAWEQAREAFAQRTVVKSYAAVCAPASATWPPEPPDGGHWWIRESEANLASTPVFADCLTAVTVPGVSPVSPRPSARQVHAPLGHGATRAQVAVRDDGLDAQTTLQPLATCGARTLMGLTLQTGHRHQARVHLAWLGYPIVGDQRYGTAAGQRLCLHAAAIDLSPAIPGEVEVAAPLPQSLIDALADISTIA